MYVFLCIIAALIILVILILVLKITVHIQYYHAQDNDDLQIELRLLFGLIKYKKKIPLIKVDDNSPTIVIKEESKTNMQTDDKKNTRQISAKDIVTSLENAKKLLQHVVDLHKIVKSFMKKVKIDNLEWKSIVGLGDAAHTAMITGVVWATKGSIVGIISQYMRLQNMPKIEVIPHFQVMVSQTLFKCMIQFRLGHAIVAGLKLVKFWKGGMPHFKKTDAAPFQEENSL